MNSTLFDYLTNTFISALLFVTSTMIYYRVSVLPIHCIYKKFYVILAGCLFVSILYSALYPFYSGVALIISYLFPSLFFVLLEKDNIKIRFIICFFVSCFTRITLLLAIILTTTFSTLIYPLNTQLSVLIIYPLCFCFALLFTRIKRFRKGFQFFQNERRVGLGLIITGILFVLLGIVFLYTRIDELLTIIVLSGVFISSFGLYFWIRRSITAHYRERLQLKSEEHFQEILKEKEEENVKLTKSNEFLAKVVHRDNHLMASLDSSINAYFESDDKAFKDNLLREIQTLANERGELIEKEQRDSKLLPSTGNSLIDGTIGDLYIKAVAHGIDFDLTVSETVDEIIGKYISQTELQTLLCDHIKDAVIAVDAAGKDNGRILVELSVKNGDYTIAVFDNGVDFYPEMLAKLGKERVTTHAENGGSGIGFMTTFETLRKAHASLSITEFENKTPFSKSVSFIFNGENSFIIKSYRAEQLKAAINREDVVII